MRRSPLLLARLLTLVLASLVPSIALEGCGTTPTSAPAAAMDVADPSTSELALLHPGTLLSPRKGMIDPLWPNDDGRFWQYRVAEVWTPIELQYYKQAADVPPAPSVWDLAARLRDESRARNGGLPDTPTGQGTWTLRFNGRVTTQSGAEGQNLTESLLDDPLPGARASVAGAAGSAFWSHLAAARPDLAPAVQKRLGLSASATLALDGGPILLHGGAWEKTAEHIGTYGDLNRQIAWLYLVANVLPGSTFNLQLVPDLASDVWLHGLVLPRRLVTHPQSERGAVEVLYLIDYGVSQVTDAGGGSLGAIRSIEYGNVTYVPGVGPISAFERALLPGPLPPEGVQLETWSSLTSTGPGTPAVADLH